MDTAHMERQANLTLFERLGGSDGIGRIVDGMVAAHLENPVIRARFLPYLGEPERVEAIKHQICRFFEAHAEGPEPYGGRSMADAHRGMNIDEAEYVAAMDDVLATMAALGHDAATRGEVTAMLFALKDDIVRV